MRKDLISFIIGFLVISIFKVIAEFIPGFEFGLGYLSALAFIYLCKISFTEKGG